MNITKTLQYHLDAVLIANLGDRFYSFRGVVSLIN